MDNLSQMGADSGLLEVYLNTVGVKIPETIKKTTLKKRVVEKTALKRVFAISAWAIYSIEWE